MTHLRMTMAIPRVVVVVVVVAVTTIDPHVEVAAIETVDDQVSRSSD